MNHIVCAAMTGTLCALMVCGCVRTEVSAKTRLGQTKTQVFPELKRYNLKLELAGSHELLAGDGGRINFKLTNVDTVPVTINEWYINEPDNLIVYCQPWFPGTTDPDPAAWIALAPEIRQPAAHFPLRLEPQNQVMVAVTLPFVDKLVISENGERRYFIRAELNLKSVKVESPVTAIAIRPMTRDALRRQR